nr:lipid II flippase MurJ [Tissierella sp. P1]
MLTSKVLAHYAFGLVAMALIPLITRAYYSIQDMKTPIVISLAALGINTILDLSLAPLMGSSGIALGTSISIILALIYGIFDLNRKLDIVRDDGLKDTVLKIGVATVVMTESMFLAHGTISTLLNDLLINNILDISFSTIAGVGVYAEVCKVLRVKI